MKIKYLKILVVFVVVFSFFGCSTDETEFENKNSIELINNKVAPIPQSNSIRLITIFYKDGTTQAEIDILRDKYFTDAFEGGTIGNKPLPQFYVVDLNPLTSNNLLIDVWRVTDLMIGKPGDPITGGLSGEEDIDFYTRG